MKVLLITGDARFAAAIGADLERLPEPITLQTSTTLQDAMECIAKPGLDAAVIDLAHPLAGTGLSVAEAARKTAPDVSLVAIVSVASQAAQVVTTGAHAFVRLGPNVSQSLATAIRAVKNRRRLPSTAALRVLYVSRDEPVRDQSVGPPLAIERVVPRAGIVALPPPYDMGPLECDAIVLDLSSGAVDLLEVLQDTVRRSGSRPVLVLADGGDRAVATAAFRLGASQVIAKNGAWPIRLSAAIEQTVSAYRAETHARQLEESDIRHRAMLDTLPVGVMVLTAEGMVQSVNAAGLALTGGTPLDSIVGTALVSHIVDGQQQDVRAFLSETAEGRTTPLRVVWRRGDERRPIELTGSKLSTGDRGALIMVSINAVADRFDPAMATATGSQVPPEEHAALRAHFEAATHEASVLRNQLVQLEAEQAAFSGRMETEVAALQDLFSQVAQEAEVHGGLGFESASKEIARLDAALGEAEVALAMASEAHAREVQELRAMLADAQRDGESQGSFQAEALKEQLTAALEAVRTTESTLKAESERHRQQRDQALVALQEAEGRYERTIAGHRRELDELHDAYKRVEQSWNAARARVEELEGRAQYEQAASADREHRFAALAASVDQERTATASHREAVAALQAEVERLKTALQKAEQAAAEKTREIYETSAQLQRARAEHEQALGARAQEIVTLCSALDAAEQAKTAVVTDHSTELDSVRAAFGERETGYRARIASLEAEIAALRRTVEGRLPSEAREQFERQIAALHAALAQAQGAMAEQVRVAEAADRRAREQAEAAARANQERVQVEANLRGVIDDRDATLALGNANLAALQRRLESVAAWERRWFENDLLAVAVTAVDGSVMRTNATFGRLFGEAGREVLEHIPESWRRLLTSADAPASVDRERVLPITEGTMTLPSGREVWYAQIGRLASDGGELVVERWFLDTTARRQLEMAQREHRGVETVGRVAGEFVREIEHRVAEARDIARAVLQNTDEADARTTDLRALLDKTTDVQSVTRQFLAFSRGRLRMPDWVGLSEMLQSLQPLLQHLTGEGIALVVDPPSPRLCVNAPREPLVRTLLSLVTACAQALPLGGQIAIKLTNTGEHQGDADMSALCIQASGFGQQALREPGPLDPALVGLGASLRTANETPLRQFELRLRTIEQRPSDDPAA